MIEVIALVVSLIAAAIALVGPYLENLRTGRLRMFYPQDIYFMPHPGIGYTAQAIHGVRLTDSG
ncbi:hypothetical protein ETAA1_38370 [Urbifossiella limnaea]|uniref:Uncharacterized protein n=1 Tax=Urbifossiella limnaea TaxID=2528023 RepID=A0A517XWL9_9BACT|nr:hypothetical protein ETAA1_38370 [Urbifossiella limnaea]